MKLLLFIFLILFFKIPGNAALATINLSDTLDHKTRIKELWRQFKKDNKFQLHIFESTDSTIWFGTNKKKDLLVSVMVSTRSAQGSFWFFYNSRGVFRISVLDKKKTRVGNRRKTASCTYYFENDKLFHSIEDGKSFDAETLLQEAKKYWALGTQYLKG